MNFKGIIFDLDGTLADTLADMAGSMNRVLTRYGYPIRGKEDYKLLVGRGLENLVRQALPAKARRNENIEKCLAALMDDYNKNCLVETQLYAGIPELLDALTQLKLKLAVFSNKSEPLTHKIVSKLMGNVPFIKVTGARADYPKKPDPAGALEICTLMAVPPEQILYMGDTDVDMITANRAAMYAVGALWGFRSKEELQAHGARVLLNHPQELIGMLFE
ncbi:MAG: HAD family hydrolase [Bacteroidales bacterium]|nr:HAD family hydrolase [Bacteroidales bacterium]